MRLRSSRRYVVAFVGLALLGAACTNSSASPQAANGGQCTPAKTPVITFAAYSNVYDTYGKIQTAFGDQWKASHNGQSIIFQSSYGGSTTQAQNVVSGFPADVVALSLMPDVQSIQKAGLITHNVSSDPNGGVVATTDVVFVVRPGNPKGIHDWADLAKPGLQILTPDPSQSGGAKWNIVAAYGAALRNKVPGTPATPEGATTLLTNIFKNVTVMDKSANDSLKNFESGNGDVAITYESQALTSIAAGKDDQIVYPSSTVSIQTPVAVVDKNAASHCVSNVAKAFVQYLQTPDAQALYASVGNFRPIDVATAAKATDTLPALKNLFTTDDVGGWDQLINDTVFGANGAFTKALTAAKG